MFIILNLLTTADQKQRDQTEKVQQLRAELNTTKQLSRCKDQHILKLESELEAMKVKMSSPSDQLEQPQREMEMLQEKSKDGIAISQKQSEEVYLLELVLMMHVV